MRWLSCLVCVVLSQETGQVLAVLQLLVDDQLPSVRHWVLFERGRSCRRSCFRFIFFGGEGFICLFVVLVCLFLLCIFFFWVVVFCFVLVGWLFSFFGEEGFLP